MTFDFIGTVFSLFATYLFVQGEKFAWSISIYAILINGWLYFNKGIYAHFGLECFYLLTCIYGWVQWSQKTGNAKNPETIPQTLSWHHLIWLAPAGFFLYYFILQILILYTDSSIPSLDALTTALSILAQLLMCKKIIETWIIWFVADAILAFVYWAKGLPFHSFLMAFYTFMAIAGYIKWMAIIRGYPVVKPRLSSTPHA